MRLAVLGAAWLVFVIAVYVPDVGRGFVKDDFGWVAAAAQAAGNPLSVLTADAAGTFYRPLVSLTFVGDYLAYGLHARGYGFTNLILYMACAALILWLFVELGLTAAAAATGAFVWAINPHGIDMSILWLSGRTSLLMALCSCGAVLGFVKRRRLPGAFLFFCALLAKEDAVAVPLIVVACRVLHERRWRVLAADAGVMAGVLAVYFVLRADSHALTPSTAPWFYQLSTDWRVIAINAAHYLDRGATAAAAAVLLAMALHRARPALAPAHRRLLLVGALWFAAGLLVTVRIPVRSSLYVVFPSIGAALACAAIVDALQARAVRPAPGRALAVLLASLVLVLLPVYWARNDRWVEPARVAARTLRTLALDSSGWPEHGVIVLEDERVRFSTFTDAFGQAAATIAVQLFTGRRLDVRVAPPGEAVRLDNEVVRYQLTGGRVARRE